LLVDLNQARAAEIMQKISQPMLYFPQNKCDGNSPHQDKQTLWI
jgi:hypothetical protein